MKAVYRIITDYNYLSRALCLYRSLEPYLSDSWFCFFCLDKASKDILEQLYLPHAFVLDAPEYPELRTTRSYREYCWTLKPAVLLQTPILAHWHIYLDADMMAFGDPGMALDPEANVILTPHRFSEQFKKYASRGFHNAGFAAFSNNEGIEALRWWQERCNELCPEQPVGPVYADQTYLDEMDDLFEGVISSPHRGLNVGPWNISDGIPEDLLLYHFQGLKIFSLNSFDLYSGDLELSKEIKDRIYRPYILNLVSAALELKRVADYGPKLGKWYQSIKKRNAFAL